MDSIVWTEENLKKSRSPFSIYFYLKKSDGNYEDAKKLYGQFLEEKSPFRNPKNRPNSIEYWQSRGCSLIESKQKVKEFQSKPLDLDKYVEKYGEEIGTSKYQTRKENYQNRFDVEINNLMKEFECDYDTAHKLVCEKRRKCSPRTLDYWIGKGHSLEESKKMISIHQKENSPRSVFYWIKCGYTEEESSIKVSDYQDKISIDSICKRYKCDKISAFDIQESILEKTKFTRIKNGLNIDIANDYDYFVYKKEVNYETKKTLRLYKTSILKKNKNYSLDHKYSIFYGFYNDVPPKIIGSIYNLEYLPKSKNCSKQTKCSIDLKTLNEMYENEN